MTLDEIILDMHDLEEDLRSYERKYGVLSETFYQSYMSGEEPENDAWVLDWTRWAGAYGMWLRTTRAVSYGLKRRSEAYRRPPLPDMSSSKRSRYEPVPVPA